MTRVHLTLAWTPAAITLDAAVSGGYALPYDAMAIHLPPGEGRPLQVRCNNPQLALTEAAPRGAGWVFGPGSPLP